MQTKADADSISHTYWSPKDRVLLTANNDNSVLKTNGWKWEDIPFHSEIWATVYGKEVGNIKFVGCPNVVNAKTMAIIKDARVKLAPGKPGTEVVTIRANSQRVEEREAFAALAGSNNGAPVLQMITDRHNMFGNRKVESVHI